MIYTVEVMFGTGKRQANNRYSASVIGVYDSWQKAEDAINDSVQGSLGEYEKLDVVSVNDDIEMTFYKYTILDYVLYEGFRIRQLVLNKGFSS